MYCSLNFSSIGVLATSSKQHPDFFTGLQAVLYSVLKETLNQFYKKQSQRRAAAGRSRHNKSITKVILRILMLYKEKNRKMIIKSVKMKILKIKKLCFFLMSQGSFHPKIRFRCQKVCPVARSFTDIIKDRPKN